VFVRANRLVDVVSGAIKAGSGPDAGFAAGDEASGQAK
jgi:hypothetical protein